MSSGSGPTSNRISKQNAKTTASSVMDVRRIRQEKPDTSVWVAGVNPIDEISWTSALNVQRTCAVGTNRKWIRLCRSASRMDTNQAILYSESCSLPAITDSDGCICLKI